MSDEKYESVCAHCGKRKSAHLSLWWCSNVRSSFFTPAEPEAKEATDADFELRATCPHGFSYIEDCDRCPWSPEAKEVEQDTYGATMGRRYRLCWEGNARLRAELAAVTAERDAAIADREPTPLPAEHCHCGQHSMERPDIHGINWYWSKHTREACTLELPNVRCWCGRLRSEHIDGHAAPVTPPAVDPRDVRIAELEQKLVAADVYGVELIRRIGERGARIAELETILASTRETWNEQVQELEIDRDQQRARADAAEARCEAGLPLLFTGAKERSK